MTIQEIRDKEFPQLKETLYFDYAGAMVMCQSQIAKLQDLAMKSVGNPHSQIQVSQSNADMEELRYAIADLFSTSLAEYDVIFTQNATHAIQKWAEIMPWSTDSHFSYLVDNHNSILGVRTISSQHGASVKCERDYPEPTDKKLKVFAFPMMSNFSGRKYPIEWITKYQQEGGYVFLDAASASPPDLSVHKPDFVSASLLKLTGAHGGVLLVRRDRIEMLGATPPSGGTVLFSCARSGNYRLLPLLHQRLEAGTQSYIDIGLAIEGIRVRRLLGSEKEIQKRLEKLSQKFVSEMEKMEHSNGMKLVEFTPKRSENEKYGASFSFNLFNAEGNLIGHQDVHYLFSVFNVVARLGGHCNPGAGFPALGWSEDDIERIAEENLKGGRCISNLCELQGRPVSTIRVSFGPPTTEEDVDHLLSLIRKHFINGGPCPPTADLVTPMTVTRLFVYPIQGAVGFEVKKWPLLPTGLLYDRNFKIVDAEGADVRTTNCTHLAQLWPSIDLEKGTMTLTFNGESASIDLRESPSFEGFVPEKVKSKGDVIGGDVTEFLRRSLRRCCFLVRLDPASVGKMAFSAATEESMATVDAGFDLWRLRVNLLLKGAPAFTEEGKMTKPLAIGSTRISVWRWRVVCMTSSVDPSTGVIEKKSLQELMERRSRGGALTFGVLFGVDTEGETREVCVGDSIHEL